MYGYKCYGYSFIHTCYITSHNINFHTYFITDSVCNDELNAFDSYPRTEVYLIRQCLVSSNHLWKRKNVLRKSKKWAESSFCRNNITYPLRFLFYVFVIGTKLVFNKTNLRYVMCYLLFLKPRAMFHQRFIIYFTEPDIFGINYIYFT